GGVVVEPSGHVDLGPQFVFEVGVRHGAGFVRDTVVWIRVNVAFSRVERFRRPPRASPRSAHLVHSASSETTPCSPPNRSPCTAKRCARCWTSRSRWPAGSRAKTVSAYAPGSSALRRKTTSARLVPTAGGDAPS